MFDYTHGGFDHTPSGKAHALSMQAWLAERGTEAELEDSGDLYRLWMPTHSAYFWPAEGTRCPLPVR